MLMEDIIFIVKQCASVNWFGHIMTCHAMSPLNIAMLRNMCCDQTFTVKVLDIHRLYSLL